MHLAQINHNGNAQWNQNYTIDNKYVQFTNDYHWKYTVYSHTEIAGLILQILPLQKHIPTIDNE